MKETSNWRNEELVFLLRRYDHKGLLPRAKSGKVEGCRSILIFQYIKSSLVNLSNFHHSSFAITNCIVYDARQVPMHPSWLYRSEPQLQAADVNLRMYVLNMVLHLILPGKPLVTFISTPSSGAAELPRPSTMVCCMALEIGQTTIGLLADRAGLSRTRGGGWRLGGNRIHRRDQRSGIEKTGISRDDYVVGDLRRSDEDRAMCIVLTRNGIIAIIVATSAHSR